MKKYRREVLDYMYSIGFKVSIQWWIGLMLGGTILAWLIGMIDQIFTLLIVLTSISIFSHYCIKFISKSWYSYYVALYDCEQTIKEIIGKLESMK